MLLTACLEAFHSNNIAKLEVVLSLLGNSYTMGYPPVRDDNPRALASELYSEEKV